MQLNQRTLLPLAALTLAPAGLSQISFTQAAPVSTGQRANEPIAADLDGDGNLDLAVTTDGNGNQDLIELFRGAGDGTFTPAGTVFLPNSSSPAGLAASDVDGDGDIDLAVVLSDFNQVAIARNSGAMAFTLLPGIGTGGAESRTIAAGDMDGDGDADFCVGSRDSNSVSVLLNVGGNLSLAGAFPAGQEPRDVAVGDFNGDGLGDVAAAAHDSRQVAFLFGTGGGALGAATFLGVPGGTRPSGLTVADMDGDGDLDVIAGNGDDNSVAQNFVSIYTNTGGTFTGPVSFPAGGLDAGDVVAADFDLDGVMDVVVGHESSVTAASLRGLGGGTLGVPSVFAAGPQPSGLAAGDLNGDGSADLAVSTRQMAGLNVFLNDAAGGPTGTNYCTANANSTGAPGSMGATGTRSVGANDLGLTATSLPSNSVGIFITSRASAFVPNPDGSSGNLCLGGAIGRYANNVLSTGATGEFSLAINLVAMPTPTGLVSASAGETWYFQAWFRDNNSGVLTSNFTDGLRVVLIQ